MGQQKRSPPMGQKRVPLEVRAPPDSANLVAQGPARWYPQTPLLKGRDALSNAMTSLGTSIMGVSLIGFGLRCMSSPAVAAAMHGLREAPPGWGASVGLRDAGLGCVTLALHVSHRSALRVFVPLLLFVPLADFYAIYLSGGDAAAGVAQCAGAMCIIALSVFIHLDPLVPSGRLVVGRAINESV